MEEKMEVDRGIMERAIQEKTGRNGKTVEVVYIFPPITILSEMLED